MFDNIWVVSITLAALILITAYFFNRPGKLTVQQLATITANARHIPQRHRYIDNMSDCHWGRGYRRFKHLDKEDQENVLLGVVYWFNTNDQVVPDINRLIGRVSCEYGTLYQMLFYVAERTVMEKLTQDEIRELPASIIYKWLCDFKG